MNGDTHRKNTQSGREWGETSLTRTANATISSKIAKYNGGIFIDLLVAGENIKVFG